MENFDFDKVLEYMQWNKSHREYDDEGRCIGKSTWKMYVGPNEHTEFPLFMNYPEMLAYY